MNYEERIKELENLVAELLKWKKESEEQQILAPLDDTSKNILAQFFTRI